MCETVKTTHKREVLSFPKTLLFCSKVFSNMWANPEFTCSGPAAHVQHSFTHIPLFESSRLQTRFSRKQICPHTQTFTLAAVTRRIRSVCTVRMHIRHNTRFPVWKISDHSKTGRKRWVWMFGCILINHLPENKDAKKIKHRKWVNEKNRGIVLYWYPSIHWSHAKRFWEKKVFYVHQDRPQFLFLVRKSESEMQLPPNLSQLICILPLPVFWLFCIQLF